MFLTRSKGKKIQTDKLAWYSPGATYSICLHVLEHGFSINRFRPNWPCQNCRDSCNPSQISWTFVLQYRGQLHLPLSHKNCFCLLSWRYHRARTSNAYIFKSDYVALSFVYLSNRTQSEAWHKVSDYPLPRTVSASTTTILPITADNKHDLNVFGYIIYVQ